MKDAFKIIWIFACFIFINISCDYEDETFIVEPVQSYGIQGVVMDTSGKPLTDVKIYNLFNYNYIPNKNFIPKNNLNMTSIDSFGFQLFQNFPNPVYNSSFIRFSIPDNMDIELTLKNLVTGDIISIIEGFYNYGFYQHYLDTIVNKYQLENGPYLISLKAKKDEVLKFFDEKKLFVISDIGNPNIISNKDGIYFFDYKTSFIGDTIISTIDGTFTYPIPIGNRINLLFKKDGYIPAVIDAFLYPELLINRDVILIKEEQR